jgi:hypothetical protein
LPFTDIEDRDDVRVARETRSRQRFSLEPLSRLLVAREAVVEHLDGDPAAELTVLGEIDPAHASLADEARVLVSVREDSCLDRHTSGLSRRTACRNVAYRPCGAARRLFMLSLRDSPTLTVRSKN